MTEAPRELTCVAGLRLAPPAPWLAKEVHGKPIVAFFVCYSGPLEDAERVLAPIKAYGKPGRRHPAAADVRVAAGAARRHPAEGPPLLLEVRVPAILRPRALHRGRSITPRGSSRRTPAILIFPIDGALNELPEDHSAVGNRDAVGVLNIAGAWERPADDGANIEWARTAWRDLRQFSTGGTYVNFLTEEEGDDRTRAAYRTNYPRLARLKAEWDPDNLFHTNKNISRGLSRGSRAGSRGS